MTLIVETMKIAVQILQSHRVSYCNLNPTIIDINKTIVDLLPSDYWINVEQVSKVSGVKGNALIF